MPDDPDGLSPGNNAGDQPANDPDAASNVSTIIDLEKIPTVPITPPSGVDIIAPRANYFSDLPPTQRAGLSLSRFILWIISGCLTLLFVMLFVKSFDASSQIPFPKSPVPDSVFNQQKEIIRALQEEKKSYRDFIFQFAQMILLNLLLPTLTAVLGYIFGSHDNSLKKED